jgi:hypothetical protein
MGVTVDPPARPPRRWAVPARATVASLASPGALALLVAAITALVLDVWGVGGDLPYLPDVDEPIFVNAAVHVASGHLAPGWYGNPGSTVIYPLAALLRGWYALQDPASILHLSAPALTAHLAADPSVPYVLGRLISVFYGVAAIVPMWLIARQLMGALGLGLALLLVSVTPIVVAYSQLLRTDTAGVFFFLLTLALVLRAARSNGARWWIAAGASLGLAIGTRYFMAALGLPFLVALVAAGRPGWGGVRPSLRTAVAAVAAIPISFAACSPGLVLHLGRVVADLRFEARTVQPGADGLSPLGNFGWYVGTVLPATAGLVVLLLAVVGLVWAARRKPLAAAILAAGAVGYLAAASASPLHWDRYIIPALPIVAIFAGVALDAILRAPRTIRPARAAIAVALTAVLVLPPAATVVAADQLRSAGTTRSVATAWAEATLPSGALVCEEMYTFYGGRLNAFRIFALANLSLAEYRAKGCAYLVTSSAMSSRFTDAARYPRESAFYRDLPSAGPRIASFAPSPSRAGPIIEVYELH